MMRTGKFAAAILPLTAGLFSAYLENSAEINIVETA